MPAALGANNAPTGLSVQRHVIYSLGAYWLFYIDGMASTLNVRSSQDFVSWSQATSFSLPLQSSGDGRTLSVEVAHGGTTDIVEIAVTFPCVAGTTCNTLYLLRGTITGATPTFALDMMPASKVCEDKAGTPPYVDAPSVSIASDGFVTIASGCDPMQMGGAWTVYTSMTKDPGTPGWQPMWYGEELYGGGGVLMAARALTPLGPNQFLFLGQDPNDPSTNIYWSAGEGTSNQGGWSSSGNEVWPGTSMDATADNGWTVYGPYPNVRVMRYTTTGVGFEQSVIGGSSSGGAPYAWTAEAAPSKAHTPAAESGVFAAVDGTKEWAFIIDSANSNVMASSGSESAVWGPWTSVVPGLPSGGSRQYLSGNATPVNHGVPLIWTEGPNANNDLEIWGGLFCTQ